MILDLIVTVFFMQAKTSFGASVIGVNLATGLLCLVMTITSIAAEMSLK
jgi:hypothetical protein